ncbi:hypothetical protein [Dyella sp. S184]|uniref:hypothetical protein n=1 Tax=Dyella sp. S184 TaxID=1641862 RepID=UPI00131E038C|nr:hypothetical protein [Dyella sp. S184]
MEDRNKAVPHHTEDKGWWYLHGERLEETFVQLCQTKLQIEAKINPDKTYDKTAPDLVVEGCLADLKTQNTPFFTAGRYRLDPRFAVTFNRKDYERYKALYPEIFIYFWLDWKQTQWRDSRVEYLGGFFRLPFREVADLIEKGAPEHTYIHRRDPGDTNAKSSFLLDIRRFEELFSVGKRDEASF